MEKARESGIPFNGPEKSIDTPAQRSIMRSAAGDAIVLLKNTKNLLPLRGDIKKIAVIGPNAKEAMTSGGGSARLRSTYTVSPLEGIRAAAKEIGAELVYAIGVPDAFKYPRLLDSCITARVFGQPGGLLEFWNEEPSKDWLDTNPDFGRSTKPIVWSTAAPSTYVPLVDGVVSDLIASLSFLEGSCQDAEKVIPDCWIRVRLS